MQTAERIYASTLPEHKTKLLNGLKIQSKFLKNCNTHANCYTDLHQHTSAAQNKTAEQA